MKHVILAVSSALAMVLITVPALAQDAGDPENVSGTRDLFLSNTVRVHRKLRAAGVGADLNVYESLSLGEYLGLIDSPESEQIFAELRAFLLEQLK